MVHDRRVEGETLRFGNQGALFMYAMTWWDHESGSVWSQVWGQAIDGPRRGQSLDLIPASIVPWRTWRAQHPDTLVMTNDRGGRFDAKQRPSDNWVVGIALDQYAHAFYYPALAEAGVVNDFVGPFPVVVHLDPDSRDVHTYLRAANDRVLTFALDETGQFLVDQETGSRWRVGQGLAVEGALEGELLLQLPYISAFDWAWRDFHPASDFFTESR